jgi:hypothetical protein
MNRFTLTASFDIETPDGFPDWDLPENHGLAEHLANALNLYLCATHASDLRPHSVEIKPTQQGYQNPDDPQEGQLTEYLSVSYPNQ